MSVYPIIFAVGAAALAAGSALFARSYFAPLPEHPCISCGTPTSDQDGICNTCWGMHK